MTTLSDVIQLFKTEYGPVMDKFVIHDLTLDQALADTTDTVNSPGVYVFWKNDFGVIKVGKSQVNSKARALTHVSKKWNTRNEKLEMASLAGDPSCHLALFNVTRKSDVHWILGLECFLEWNLRPVIPSGRCG